MEYYPYFSYESQRGLKFESDLFASYGSPLGIDVEPEINGKPTPLTLRHLRCINQLSAKQPCLPLYPPNKVVNEFSRQEPCMAQIEKDNADFKRKLLSLQGYFSEIYGKRKTRNMSQLQLQRDVRLFTRRVKMMSQPEAVGHSAEDIEMEKMDLLFNLGKPFQMFCNLWSELLLKDIQIKKSNFRYSGGLLRCESVTPERDSGVILSTGGPSLQTLCCSKIDSTDDNPVINQQQHVDIDGKLFEIDSRVLNNSVWCLGRLKSDTCLYRIEPDESPLNLTLIEKTAFDISETLSSISLSPYLEDEYLIGTENGDIFLKNSTNGMRTKLVHCDHNFECSEPFWACEWGMHPREICVTNRTGVSLYDIRATGSSLAHSVDLFTLPHSLLNSKERIYISKSHPRESNYRILATDKTVVLTDQRFPNHPVLHWRHLLQTPPVYIDVCSDTTKGVDMTEDVLLLGNQASGELHCMQMTTRNQPGNAPAWTCVPWRTSPIRDIYRYTSDEGLVVDPLVVEQRLKAPLAGIAALPLKQGFTALQLTSLGDLFYQSYTPSQYDTDKTQTYGSGSSHINVSQEYLDLGQNWLKEAEQLLDRHPSPESSEDEAVVSDNRRSVGDGQGMGDNQGAVGDNRECQDDSSNLNAERGGGDAVNCRTSIGVYTPNYTVNVSHVFNDLRLSDSLPHEACSFCQGHPDLTLENFTCTVCGTDTLLSRRLWQGVQLDFPDTEYTASPLEDDVLSGTNLDPADAYSTILLKLWNGETLTDTDLNNRESEWLLKNNQVKVEVKKEDDSASSSSSLFDDTDDEMDESGQYGIPSSQTSLFKLLGIPSYNTAQTPPGDREESMSLKSETSSIVASEPGVLHSSQGGDSRLDSPKGVNDNLAGVLDNNSGQLNKVDQDFQGGLLFALGIREDISTERSPTTAASYDLTSALSSSSEMNTTSPQKKAAADTADREMQRLSVSGKVGGDVTDRPPRKRHRRSSTSSIGSLSSQSSVRSYASSVPGFGTTPTKLRRNWVIQQPKAGGSPWSQRTGEGNSAGLGSRLLPHGLSTQQSSPTMFKSPASVRKKKKSVMGF